MEAGLGGQERAIRALVFDSGLGGLTVLAEIRRLRPDVEIVYVADDAAFPYGRLGEPELIARVETVMARVVADVATRHRRHRLQHRLDAGAAPAAGGLSGSAFVGTVPAIKPAARASRSGLISVLATRGTAARDYTQALVRDHAAGCEVTLVGSALLAPIAERRIRGQPVDGAEIAREIAPCFVEKDGRRTDQVVLACTHFPLLIDRLEWLRPLACRLRRSGAGDRAPARLACRPRSHARAGAPRGRGDLHQRRRAACGLAKGLASIRVDVYAHGGDRLGSGLSEGCRPGSSAIRIRRWRECCDQPLKQPSERPAPMRTSVGQPVRLVDYRVPDFLIDMVELDISLDPHATRVVSTLSLRPNPAGRQ